eukprot:COSAG05_NODE_9_length_39734_cov_180.598067_19_plen_82_part_00
MDSIADILSSLFCSRDFFLRRSGDLLYPFMFAGVVNGRPTGPPSPGAASSAGSWNCVKLNAACSSEYITGVRNIANRRQMI